MGFYDEEKTAREYIAMAEGYDGSFLIDVMAKHVPEYATVLEIGMGPGKDLDLLGARYQTTGSDTSSFFLTRYQQLNPTADLMKLDAVTLATNRKFDCIYSNKVLHHLDDQDLDRSLQRQKQVLNSGGFVMHSFWSGSGVDEIQGLKFHYHTEASLRAVFGAQFAVLELATYKEIKQDDSIYVLAQLQD